jgi:hypothetical protein
MTFTRQRQRFVVVALIVLAALSSSCAGNKSPSTVAANVAHNGTILVKSVDDVQKFVIDQEAKGVIPRNLAVTSMEGIGRGLDAARHVPGALDRLASLPAGSAEAGPIVKEVQDALALVTKDVVSLALPNVPEAVRLQLTTLAAAVNSAISAIQAQIANVKGAK